MIKQISALETYPIRLEVLRKGMTLNDCIFEGDNNESTFHLGLFNNEKLIAVSSYMLNKNIQFTAKNQYQLRGMAVLESYRGLKHGEALLQKGEEISKEKKVDFIWFNAREIAVNFYKRNGYKTIGAYFNIEGVGKHIIMFKKID